MSDKCWCESAKEDIDKAYTNPNPYHGVLQDVMDAEIDYAKMCAICPCRKRRLEDTGEPAKKRKEVESKEAEAHEQESEEPEPHEEEAKKRKEDEDDEDSKSEVSLVIAEFDSEEEPDEEDPPDVEEEEEERETVEGWVPGPEPPECCCAEPLAAIKQTFQEWIAYNAERKAVLEPLREAYKVARANSMTHRYELFS